jgi:hypothetical protein
MWMRNKTSLLYKENPNSSHKHGMILEGFFTVSICRWGKTVLHASRISACIMWTHEIANNIGKSKNVLIAYMKPQLMKQRKNTL